MAGRLVKQLPNWATIGIGAIVIVLGYIAISALTGGDDGANQQMYEVPGKGLLTAAEYDRYLKEQPQKSNVTIVQQNQTGVTKDEIAAAVAAALAAQAKPQSSGVSVGNGTGTGTDGGDVMADLQSRSGSAVTLDTFSTMFSASEDLGMNAPSFNFDSEATKVIVLQAGEFGKLIDQNVNKEYSQDDQVSGLKAALKAKFPGNTIPAIGFDMQTDGSSNAYGVEIKADGTYTCQEYDGDVKQCTDDSGEAEALDTFN